MIPDGKLRYLSCPAVTRDSLFIRFDKRVREKEKETEKERERGGGPMVGPDDSLSRADAKRGTRRSTTRHREDPVKAAPSGRASRISRDYVNVDSFESGVLKISILHAYTRLQDKVKICI